MRILSGTDIPTHYHEHDPVLLSDFSRESAWTRNVINTFAPPRGPDMGWLVYHTDDSRRSQTGFPDIIAVHPASLAVVAAELKTGKKTVVTDKQKAWLAALSVIPGVQVYLWRPSDADEIKDVMQRAHDTATRG